MERLQSAGHVLDPDEATGYRALSARCNLLAQDLPTISYASKELCREFAAPTHDSFARLKRVARYLVWTPRLVYNCKWGSVPENIEVYVDSDFAG